MCPVHHDIKLTFAFAWSDITLNYNIHNIYQVWEDFKLPLKRSTNVCNDDKTI